MPTLLNEGSDEREDPSLIGNKLSVASGVEYRAGLQGIYTVRGRELFATVSGTSGRALYHAGFDNDTDYLVYQEGNNYRPVAIAGFPPSVIYQGGTNSGVMSGCHYAGRHYLVNGVTCVTIESDSPLGVTFRGMGMAKTGLALGVSVTGTSGALAVTTGLIYWATEYDSARGLESLYGSTSLSTGTIASATGVYLSVSGTSYNRRSDTIRIYRTTDGGAYPDGGLLASLTIGTTFYHDTYATTTSLLTPSYGYLDINGDVYDRDAPPPVLSHLAEFDDSLVGIVPNSRSVRFTPSGYPESWPAIFEIPLDSELHDIGVCSAELNGMLGIFCRDSVWRLTRLPRDVDSVFASGEARTRVTSDRGAISQRGVARFIVPGQGAMLAFVARDGIWATNLEPDVTIPLTDGVNWDSRVEPLYLSQSVLINDPVGRRLIFLYRKKEATENRGVMYLDYQAQGIRITHPDHGALSSAVVGPKDGVLKVFTTDARAADGRIYIEGADLDASHLQNSSGLIPWEIRTSESFPAGPAETTRADVVSWMHGSSKDFIESYCRVDRTDHPRIISADFSQDLATDVGIGPKEVNSLIVGLRGLASSPMGIHWYDLSVEEPTPLGGRKGT